MLNDGKNNMLGDIFLSATFLSFSYPLFNFFLYNFRYQKFIPICMIHSALQATSDDIDLYLKKVAAMQLVMPGSIVYAPRNPIERQNTSCGIVTKLQVSSNRDMTVPELFKDIGNITVNECNALNAEILVSVYDGNQSWSIPINYCSLYGGLAGEDRALEILRSKNHNIDDAFSEIFGLYNRRMEEPDEYLWSKEQFDAFMSAVFPF